MTLNIPEYYREVSLRLNRVLDTVGLSEDIRWKKINMWIQTGKMFSVALFSVVHFLGSQAEGTTTHGLGSDIDIVVPVPTTAVETLESWVPQDPRVLVVSDENTPPGYVKLQGLYADLPLPVYNIHNDVVKVDRYGRSVVCHDHAYLKPDDDEEKHGPAHTSFFDGGLSTDQLVAVRLHTWPYMASQWLTRNRRHNWPSQETIGLIQQTGALLVPVGHKLSREKHLEWRLSISFGEKLLVWLFNSTQYKCYILLKMINKSFIKPVVGIDMLSSYHCKTCIFYLIENTPTAMWQPDNLLLCVELCLRLLYNWTEAETCPNYFIPDENMFQCKVYGHVTGRLLNVLSNLLSQEGRYLARISCDNIGQKLMRACQTPLVELEFENEQVGAILGRSVFIQLLSVYQLILEPRKLERLFTSQELGLDVNSILWKFYCSIIGSKLASRSLSRESPDQHGLDMAQELLLWGSSSDVASGKLKLAAFYLVQDNIDMSEDVLNEIHANYTYKTLYVTKLSEEAVEEKLNEKLTIAEIISQCFAFPVVYDPSEIKCIPKALILEMFRTTGSDQGNPDERYVQKLATVDAKVYFHFLEFLCHYRQNKRSHKKAALDNMIYVIRHEDLEFKVTALNFVAYCLMQEGRLMNAYNVLCKSMKLMKQHNAAKWQIATLINASFRCLRGGQ